MSRPSILHRFFLAIWQLSPVRMEQIFSSALGNDAMVNFRQIIVTEIPAAIVISFFWELAGLSLIKRVCLAVVKSWAGVAEGKEAAAARARENEDLQAAVQVLGTS